MIKNESSRRTGSPSSIHALPLLLIALIMVGTLVACGEGKEDGEMNDSTAVIDTANLNNGTAEPDSATIAVMDSIVTDYYQAADSLALIFSQINTKEDVQKHATVIAQLNQRLGNLNNASITYGQPLLDRMQKHEQNQEVDKLIEQRKRLQEKPEVYALIDSIERKQ